MRMTPSFTGHTVTSLACMAWLCGCVTTAPDPLALVADREADPARRARAVLQLPVDTPSTSALHDVLWDDRQPTELRLAAMDWLTAHDEAGLRVAAARELPRVDRWEVLTPLCEQVALRQWTDLAGALVRSWARSSKQVADADRPERAALQALHPGESASRVLWRLVAEQDAVAGAAAWEVLVRTTDRDALTGQLQQQPGASPLLADLQLGWRDLHVLPRTQEQAAWLMHLSGTGDGAILQRASLAARSAGASFDGMAVRHIPILDRVGTEAPGRDHLVRTLSSRQRQGIHVVARIGDDTAVMPPRHGELAEHLETLPWPDLLAVAMIDVQLGEVPTRREVFAQADADLADTSSEHGGVLAWRGREFSPVAFPPMLRGNDHRYVPPPELIHAMYTGLAHYHFHAQQHDNAAYAGPGGGDLAFADRFGAACVVFTFIDRDTLNVDYYHEGGVVIDLGCIMRP